MRIIIYSRPYLPSIGGVQGSAALMRRHLSLIGYDITVITETASETCDDNGIVRKPKVGKLIKLVGSADLLIVRGALSLRAALPAILAGTPFVVFHEMAGSYTQTGTSNSWLRRLRRFCAAKSVLHVGVSHSVLETLDLPESSGTAVLYNPVHLAHQSTTPLPLSRRDIDVLYVGRLIDSKGIFCLPPAIRHAGEVIGRTIRVALVGDGEARARLQHLTSADQSDEWLFMGAQDQDRLAECYGRAKIVVVPSTHQEGMGMVAAEALFHGTPVLAARQPALAETIGLGGICVDPENAVEFGNAIAALLSDQPRWTELSRAARTSSARFSDEHYRAALRNLLRLAGIEKFQS